MRSRPWPLVVLAVIQILTPVTTVLFNAWALQVSPRLVIQWILERGWGGVFETLLLMPVAGIAIYRMKTWSYAVFFAAMGWSIWASYRDRAYTTGSFPAWALMLAYAFEIALVIYFLIPPVRKTFLDPSVRWWESKPRYELKAPATLAAAGATDEATVLNLSEGGAFVVSSRKLSEGDAIRLTFRILALEFSISGKIVHIGAPGAGGSSSYGVKFDHDSASRRRFRRLVRGIKEIGFQERTDMQPWHRELTRWAITLLKTGKGLVPEPKGRGKQ